MRCLLLGDLHLRGKDLNRFHEALSLAIRKARGMGCSIGIQGGDVFDRYNLSDRSASVGTLYRAFIDALDGFMLDIIPGNHDQAGAGNRHALEPLREHPNIRIHDEAEINYFPEDDSIRGIFIPWGSDISSLNPDSGIFERSIMIAHCDIPQAQTNTGYLTPGGSFSLGRDWINSFSPDIIALSHIHLHQRIPGLGKIWGGYLGSLIQCNFGEGLSYQPGKDREHQFQGFHIWDTEENSFESIELDLPRYWTIPSEYYQEIKGRIPDQDMIRIIGETPPDHLPENVQFQKRIRVEEKRIRVEGVEIDQSPYDLLHLWIKEQGIIPPKDIDDALKDIEGEAELPESAIGSLESIDRIRIRNIATHRDTQIDLSNLSGLIGIHGSNGSGKTFLMESLYASLYGEYPSRPGTLGDRVTRGFLGDASIAVDFRSGGIPCRAERKIRKREKSNKITASFIRESLEIAGPKGADVNRESRIQVGDPDLLLASIYSIQGQSGNIIDADPVDRKLLMAKLLGTDRFLPLGELAKNRGIADRNKSDLLLREIEGLKLELEGGDETKEREKELQVKLDQLKAREQYDESLLDKIRKQIAILEGESQDYINAQKDIDRIKAEIRNLMEKRDDISRRKSDIEARIQRKGELDIIAGERSSIENMIREFDREIEEYRERESDMERKLMDLRSQFQEIKHGAEREIDKLRSELEGELRSSERLHEQEKRKYDQKKESIEN